MIYAAASFYTFVFLLIFIDLILYCCCDVAVEEPSLKNLTLVYNRCSKSDSDSACDSVRATVTEEVSVHLAAGPPLCLTRGRAPRRTPLSDPPWSPVPRHGGVRQQEGPESKQPQPCRHTLYTPPRSGGAQRAGLGAAAGLLACWCVGVWSASGAALWWDVRELWASVC